MLLHSRSASPMCRHRLVVRTPGFHPGNRSSILRGDTIFYIYRGVEKWYLDGLITRRSLVQFQSPQPFKKQKKDIY